MSERTDPFALKLSPVAFSVLCFIIFQVVSYAVWLLFVDPKMGVVSFYPQPFGAYLFWGILVLVFVGFNCGMWGFSKLGQPACGILATIFTLILSSLITVVMVFGAGKMDPAFSVPAGYGAAGLMVLIGFYGFGVLATGMAGWPWDKLEQPLAGITQLFFGFFLSTIGYMLLIYPNVASWTGPGKVMMSLPTAIGWFYSCIVAWLTTFLIFENWPWTTFGSKAGQALAALFGNLVMGTVIYFALLALLKNVLIPADALAKIGATINLWPAQLGVWIVFWLIFWPNVTGNVPTRLNKAANLFARFLITYALGIILFLIDMHWFEMKVLHMSAIVPGFGGDPLTWVDLLNYVMLIYVAYFAFYPLVRKELQGAN